MQVILHWHVLPSSFLLACTCEFDRFKHIHDYFRKNHAFPLFSTPASGSPAVGELSDSSPPSVPSLSSTPVTSNHEDDDDEDWVPSFGDVVDPDVSPRFLRAGRFVGRHMKLTRQDNRDASALDLLLLNVYPYACDVCHQWKHTLPSEPVVCRSCWTALRRDLVPRFSIYNGLSLDPLPSFMQHLLPFEKCFLELVHPVQRRFVGTNRHGQRTQTVCKSGVMVLLPSPIQSYIDVLSEFQHTSSSLLDPAHIQLRINELHALQDVRLPVIYACLQHFKDSGNDLFATVDLSRRVVSPGDDASRVLTKSSVVQSAVCNNYAGLPGTAVQVFNLTRLTSQPLLYTMPFLEEKCFPYLFPSGRFGFSYTRAQPLTLKEYFSCRLRNKDLRFAMSLEYIMFAKGMIEQEEIRRAIANCSMLTDRIRTARTVLTSIESGDTTTCILMSYLLRNIRGELSYWGTVRRDLLGYVSTFGHPTLLLTLSQNYKDPHHLQIYKNVFGAVVTPFNIHTYVAKCPYFSVEYFYNFYVEYITHFIVSDNGPLGAIRHYYLKFEFQKCGALHVHILLWVDGFPSLTASNEPYIRSYINQHITCELPIDDLHLISLVRQHLLHEPSHNATCWRLDQFGHGYCRFKFPQPVCQTLRLDYNEDDVLIGYSLRRASAEQHVSSYNATILRQLSCNINLQLIVPSCRSKLYDYVTAYVTRSEPVSDESPLLASNLCDDITPQGLLQVAVDMLNKRPVSFHETTFSLLQGKKYFMFSSDRTFINTYKSCHRYRRLRSKEELQKFPDDPAVLENVLDDFYPRRPLSLESCSLFCFMRNFYISYVAPPVVIDVLPTTAVADPILCNDPLAGFYNVQNIHSVFYNYNTLSTGSGFVLRDLQTLAFYETARKQRVYLVKRRTPTVPIIHLDDYNMDDPSDRALFYWRLLFLFVPWRTEPLDTGTVSVWKQWCSTLCSGSSLQQEALSELEAYVRQHTVTITDFSSTISLPLDDESAEPPELMQPFYDNILSLVHDASYFSTVVGLQGSLTAEQRTVFSRVFDHFTSQSSTQLLLFLTAEPGCGKTYLLNFLLSFFNTPSSSVSVGNNMPNMVALGPSGWSAHLINGITLHSALGINYSTTSYGEDYLTPLPYQQRIIRRNIFNSVRYLIIDEVSLISNVLLLKIHARLVCIMNVNKPFGGLNVILSGDLCQLPPVRGAPIFADVTQHQLTSIFSSAGANSLWTLFRPVYLTDPVRFHSDTEYSCFLHRMRVGQLSLDDFNSLQRCIIVSHCLDALISRLVSPDAIVLFGTNSEVNTFNSNIISKLNFTLVAVPAVDVAISDINSTSFHSLVLSDWAVLTLRLCVGLKVMLRKNEFPHVNGSVGFITSLNYSSSGVTTLDIDFGGTSFRLHKRPSVGIFQGRYIMRYQFPIIPAYALTVHKSQGLTASELFLDMSTMNHAAVAYVAFSRVRSFGGLHILRYRSDVFVPNLPALREYSRLESVGYGMDNGSIPQIRRFITSAEHTDTVLRALSMLFTRHTAVADVLLRPFLTDVVAFGQDDAAIVLECIFATRGFSRFVSDFFAPVVHSCFCSCRSESLPRNYCQIVLVPTFAYPLYLEDVIFSMATDVCDTCNSFIHLSNEFRFGRYLLVRVDHVYTDINEYFRQTVLIRSCPTITLDSSKYRIISICDYIPSSCSSGHYTCRCYTTGVWYKSNDLDVSIIPSSCDLSTARLLMLEKCD
ncbi:unnamed protein product [Bursaphelenchus xylophilus]|uniref:ATP-dependent DNA helicase n=1 Tax=Bursaphelenchus xylophilus TaxID=6326 RepID=A0A811L799_BURXY|nr:unnamed protein product [Bursaphelenchus xylophilus]CAG9112915.1 unnamed protein product [Bursaphelenchus xylophilus]